jgi:hypothetical protein
MWWEGRRGIGGEGEGRRKRKLEGNENIEEASQRCEKDMEV